MSDQQSAAPAEETATLREGSRDLRTAIISLQERFSYFVLAASGSAIAFATIKTAELPRGAWLLPAFAAIVTWGASFCLSAYHLLLRVMAMIGDHRQAEVQLGRTDLSPVGQAKALEILDREKRQRDKRSASLGRWAFHLLLLGGLSYLVAHLQRVFYPLQATADASGRAGDTVIMWGTVTAPAAGNGGFISDASLVVTALAALAGFVIAVYTLRRSLRLEQAGKHVEAADWQRWVDFIGSQQEHPAQLEYRPARGSGDHKWAERMVARGMLTRAARGTGYTIRN